MVSFAESVREKLGPEYKGQLERLRWHDRLTSLWAPVTVLACVFLVYLVIVESADCSYLWLQPPMQGLAVVLFLWWAGLVLARLVLRRWNARRKDRAAAEELLAEVEAGAQKRPGEIKDAKRSELTEHTATLMKRMATGSPELEAATQTLDEWWKPYRKGALLDFGSGFVKALVIAMIVRSIFIEPFKIPSGSMIPTLEIGDQIFVNKFIYGVRIPFTNFVPFTIVRAPKRGDIVVFNNPLQPDLDFIKRVIGVGGDQIELRGREVVINGQTLPTRDSATDVVMYDQYRRTFSSPIEWVKDWFKSDDWHAFNPSLHFENIDGKDHYVLWVDDDQKIADGTFKVPEGNVFVMGDNRDNSSDGRFGLGTSQRTNFVFVPFGNIKGKATVIWLPLGHGGWLSNIFGGTGLRFERLFLPLTLCKDEPPRVK